MDIDVPHTEQGERPFLTALKWQGDRARKLSEREELDLYERHWHFVDVLAAPTLEELAYIRDIGIKHNSWLATECNRRILYAQENLPPT
ncbi:hypothetical protein L6172_17770 [Thalassospiraceae bacterium SW-3-3]|nr:hypothetical protein L6172_17770 [Thalassospiraceae bacterium SW-3-3]